MTAKKDHTGKRYERLVAIRDVGSNSYGGTQWLCKCDCGTEIIVLGQSLTSGNTRSCGCYCKDRTASAHSTHGLSRTVEYKTWKSIRTRCYNSNSTNFERWGGRGIQMCDRWRQDFKNFFDDMGPKPSPKHSIDRIDNDGDYSPENCRWATRGQQNSNNCRNIYVDIQGEHLHFSEAVRRYAPKGITVNKATSRTSRGWSPIDAILEPPVPQKAPHALRSRFKTGPATDTQG